MRLLGSEEETLQLETRTSEWKILKKIALAGFAEEAFIFCNEGKIHNNFNSYWQSQERYSTPCFDVLCNSNAIILKLLSDLGCNILCHSKSDIKSALAANVNENQIVFDSQVALPSHLRLVSSSSVEIIKAYDSHMIEKVSKNCPFTKVLIVVDRNEPHQSIMSKITLAHNLGLKIHGLAFNGEFNVENLKNIVDETKKKLNIAFNVIDLGNNTIPNYDFKKLLKAYPSLKIWSNVGQDVLKSSFALVTRIVDKTSRKHHFDNGTTKMINTYVLNEGVFGAFASQLIGESTELKPFYMFQSLKPTDELVTTILLGPSREDEDMIGGKNQTFLLPQLDIGDWLIFEDIGAHAMAQITAENDGCSYGSGVKLQTEDKTEQFWMFPKKLI